MIFKLERLGRGIVSLAKPHEILKETKPEDLQARRRHGCCSMNIPGFVLDLMPAKRIPALFPAAFWPEREAFASYGQDFYESGRQSARLVDKILNGQKPGEIPMEVNSKIEFVINLKTAQTMG